MKLAIMGCGGIGAKRAQAARALGIEVTAVADVDRDRACRLATGSTRACTSLAELLASEPDAVVVATSHDALAGAAREIARAGRHVLIEKPAGRSRKELAAVAQAVRRRRLVARVGYNHRFHPALAKAKALAQEGALGPLKLVRARYGHGGRPGYQKEWRFDPVKGGGGELIDQGAHLLDLAGWFLGGLTLDYSRLADLFWGGAVEDNAFLSLLGPGGSVAWLHASWSEWKNTFSFEVAGDAGKVAVEGLGGSYGTERVTFYRMLPGMGPPETTTWEFPFPDRSFELELAAFRDAVEGRPSPGATLDDALRVLALVDRAYQKGRSR